MAAWQKLPQERFWDESYAAMLAFFLMHQASRSWPLAIGSAWLVLVGLELPVHEQWVLFPSMLAFAAASEAVEGHWHAKMGSAKKIPGQFPAAAKKEK